MELGPCRCGRRMVNALESPQFGLVAIETLNPVCLLIDNTGLHGLAAPLAAFAANLRALEG
jgi:hypothetical protein